MLKKRIFWVSICVSVLMMVCVVCDAMAIDSVYTIGPGDALEISVWRDESLSRELVVPPDGVISYPLIGDINVIGMTVADLRNVVTQKIIEFIPDASVAIILKKFNSLQAYVIGKVKNPGMFSIGLDTNVMQILAMAGGLNPYASEENIHILRQVKGRSVRIPFNYKDVSRGYNLEQNIILLRGDVVVVP